MKTITKVLIVAIIVLVILIVITFIIKFGSEDSWMCTSKGWVKHGNPSAPMPTDGCERPSNESIKAIQA